MAPLALALGVFLGTAAEAAPVKATAVTSSSSQPNADGETYDAKNVADSKQATPWVEGEEGSGLGSWVQLDFAEPTKLTSFRIWNGNWASYDYWGRYSRAKELELEFSDGTKEKIDLKDEKVAELITLPKPVTAQWVKVKLKSVYSGNTFNDTSISEIQFLDDKPDTHIKVSDWRASSVYPEDADGNYVASNVQDGLADSVWCEGDKGDGSGQWIEADFGTQRAVSKLVWINGNAANFALFMKGNRASEVTLSFSDGKSETLAVKSSTKETEVTFPSHTTNKVRITFNGVTVGKEFNDLCVSEAYFFE